MTRAAVVPFGALVALTLLGFFLYPGHTWLQQDTQIYVAILEHLRDPSVLAKDIVATRPHVSYTLYDEAARAFPFDFKYTLTAEQLITRLAALAGVFLIALRLDHDRWLAMLAAAAFGLGAAIRGPEVLTFEYESVPRGLAVSLVFFALGLIAWDKWLGAGIVGAAAFLFHPPTALPFWAVAVFIWLVTNKVQNAERFLAPVAAALVLLFVAAKFQSGKTEAQHLLTVIDTDWERLMRLRATYNWLSMWPAYWLWHYPLMAAVALGALWRLRHELPRPVALFGAGLAVFGLLMMPVSYVVMEHFHWSAMASYQPARAVLFCSAFAMLFGAVAALRAPTLWESFLWFLPAYLLPVNEGLMFDAATGWKRAALIVGLAAMSAWASRQRKAIAIAALLPYLLIPSWGEVRHYPQLHSDELRELSTWAKANTGKEKVFLFAGFGRSNAAGIFRVDAQRALYVDWKGGGQVNVLRGFAFEWWDRWQKAQVETYDPGKDYATLGIDYVVAPPERAGSGAVYRNARYAVIATGKIPPQPAKEPTPGRPGA